MMKPHNPYKADVWSFGISIFYLATGHYPFPPSRNNFILRKMISENYTIPRSVDETIKTLITNCLKFDPDMRMSFAQLKSIVDAELEKYQVEQHVYQNNSKVRPAETFIVVPKPFTSSSIELSTISHKMW